MLIKDSDGRYLLHRRSVSNACDPCLWGAPGGKIEEHETVLNTARREFQEETGCVLESPRVVELYDVFGWIVFMVRGELRQEPFQPDSERKKAGPWVWVDSGLIQSLVSEQLLQSALMLYFTGQQGIRI